MKKNLPIFDIDFNEESTGIYAVSLVDDPAIEVDFIYMGENKSIVMSNEEKRLCTGPILIPRQLIYRRDEDGEYYIRYSEEAIRQAAEKFMFNGFHTNTDLQHSFEYSSENVLVEMWVIEDPENDKANALGFNLPKGTLMATYKINDDSYWEKVKSGEVKGFSIEALGNFIPSGITLSKTNKIKKEKNMSFLEKLKQLIQAEEEEAKAPDTVYIDADGKEIHVDAETKICIREDAILEAGEYLLENGNLIVVDEEGKFVEEKSAEDVKAEQPEEEKPAEAEVPVLQGAEEDKNPEEFENPENPEGDGTTPVVEEETPAENNELDEIKNAIAELKAAFEALKAEVEDMKDVPSVAPVQQKKTVEAAMSAVDKLKLVQSLYN